MKNMSKQVFASRLLNYHGGGGTPTYALGSHLFANQPVTPQMIAACRDEMRRDTIRLNGHVACACYVWEVELTRWLNTGKALWE